MLCCFAVAENLVQWSVHRIRKHAVQSTVLKTTDRFFGCHPQHKIFFYLSLFLLFCPVITYCRRFRAEKGPLQGRPLSPSGASAVEPEDEERGDKMPTAQRQT